MFYNAGSEYFEGKNCAHTASEIAHQPEMWRKLAKYLVQEKANIAKFFDSMGDMSKVRVILTGAGSSGFVGSAVASFVSRASGIKCEAIHTTDIVSAPGVCFPTSLTDAPTLLISFARSGNSPESEGAVKYARAIVKNLYEIAIVCDGGSRLSKATEQAKNGLVLVMPEGTNDKGFAMTSSVSTMTLAGVAALCHADIEKIATDIDVLATHVEGAGFAKAAETCASWGFERAWYLGSLPFTALVQEGALKMMELSNGQVVSGYNNSPEFRHGPKTVMNPKTLTIHFVSHNAFTAKYDLDLVNELYSQRDGNKVVVIHDEKCDVDADLHVHYKADGYVFSPCLAIGIQGLVFMQLLSMFTSLALGVPTDNPSPSGLVNRVVQGVTVYDYQ